jgi:hypothetical protein
MPGSADTSRILSARSNRRKGVRPINRRWGDAGHPLADAAVGP